MRFNDFSPSSSPSLEQQWDALQKGLGRTMQWATSGHLADAPLLEACLHDKRHDMQCEDPRGNWLWNLIQAVNAHEHFRELILNALNELSDERNAEQLCEIARHYAETGDEAFRRRLYEIVEQKPFDDSAWLGEEEVMQLNGEQAFLFAARVRGKRLTTIEWDWDDENLVGNAEERFGEDLTSNLLSSANDTEIKRFYENWQEQKKRKPIENALAAHRDRMQAITPDDIIQAAKSEDQCGWLRGWGMHTDEDSLKSILGVLWELDEAKIICKLLRAFSNRALPEFDSRLIDFCRHNDEKVQWWAFIALKKNSAAAIRKFALEQLEVEATGPVVSLFIRNFENGDECRILEAMKPPAATDQLHWLLGDVIEFLKNNPEADCSKLGVVTYSLTPCENCRLDAARLLCRQSVAPIWMIEECRYDSNEECRELVGKS